MWTPLRLVGLLLLGAVTAAVVAMWAALRSPVGDTASSADHLLAPRPWYGTVPRSWGPVAALGGETFTGTGVSEDHLSTADPAGGPNVLAQWTLRGGWPLRALQCEVSRPVPVGVGAPSGFRTPPASRAEGIEVEWLTHGVHTTTGRRLPIIPIWIGLLVDAFVWAIPWALLLYAILWVRGVFRRRRGRCAACGHPVEPSSPCCPECGRRFRRRRRAQAAA